MNSGPSIPHQLGCPADAVQLCKGPRKPGVCTCKSGTRIPPESPREHFERLMAEGKVEEAEQYLDALEMFIALGRLTVTGE